MRVGEINCEGCRRDRPTVYRKISGYKKKVNGKWEWDYKIVVEKRICACLLHKYERELYGYRKGGEKRF
jgi:hypothetical protein